MDIKEEMNGLSDGVYIVPEDSYFVMGDNRNHSTDSRSVQLGPVKEGYIQGKAIFLLFPGVTPYTEERDWGRIGLID